MSNIKDYIYDLECYPNFFSCALENAETGATWLFEISEWKNDGVALYEFIMALSHLSCRMVGFNNIHYDYPLLHLLLERKGLVNYELLKAKSNMIFSSGFGNQNAHTVREKDRFIKQIDLLKIHHFDNEAKSTSLKMLEFNMRSYNIKDLPFDPNLPLTRGQADELIIYNKHDVSETKKFYEYSLSQIQFRDELSIKYNKDFLNYNDTKIGEYMIISKLQEANIPVYKNHRTIQSRRDSVVCKDVMLPYLHFESEAFNNIKDFFEKSVLDEKDDKGLLKVKGFFKGVTCEIDGLEFKFGAGGIHASRKKEIFKSSDTHDLLDWDVASYYPNLAIKNNFYPEHLTKLFCEIYLTIYKMRQNYTKEEIENAIYKLALNAVFGNSNARYSVFHDPKYLLSITINGQLLLCMLAEQLMKIPDLKMIQLNTDGLTFLVPKKSREFANSLWEWWQNMTGLVLEEAEYSNMSIRDVNSYLAVKTNGSVKRIGCYAYVRAADKPATREVAWHKNNSSLVIAKAAEAALVYNQNIEHFIKNHKDIYDFMLVTKVPRTSNLYLRKEVFWGDKILGKSDTKLQNISRYYPSKNGGQLVKVMPHTITQKKAWKEGDHYKHKKTGKYKVVKAGNKPPSGMFELVTNPSVKMPPREINVQSGVMVKDCSNMDDFNREDLDYDFYIEETKKIVNSLLCS